MADVQRVAETYLKDQVSSVAVIGDVSNLTGSKKDWEIVNL
jgi:hypothetical protein